MTELAFEDMVHKDPCKCVVRLRTTVWADDRGLHVKRSLNYLRRQCVGTNLLQYDVEISEAALAVANILNLDECKDGVYEVVSRVVGRDWEGEPEGWEHRLVPYTSGGAA